MRKATLKHVEGQYILISIKDTKESNTPPIYDRYYATIQYGLKGIKTWVIKKNDSPNLLLKANLVTDVYEIIAAENLESVKGIRIEHNNHLLQSKFKRVYEILNNKEVEVEEYEDYWLIKL